MLAVTEAAADAISSLTAQDGMGDEGGLRFALQPQAGPAEEEGAALAVSLAPAPADGDQVVTADAGAHVFLESGAADFLADKVLDVQPDPDGQLSFAVLQQE